MNSRTVPIQFDPTQHYILSEAFFRVGLALFPYSWTGHEQFAVPVNGHENIKAHKADLENDRTRLVKQARVLAVLDVTGLSQEEFDSHIKTQSAANERILAIRDELNQIGRTFEAEHHDNEEWLRRTSVENRLCRAFGSKDLTLVCGASFNVIWDSWHREADFIVSFTFSLVYAPRRLSARRRNTAYISKSQFDLWYAIQPDFNSGAVHRTREERVEAFFRTCISSADMPPKKAMVIANLRKEFSDMSDREAVRHWGRFAPDNWKKAGPKSKW